MRSQDGLFVPLVSVALLCLLAVRLHLALSRRIDVESAHPRWRLTLRILTVVALTAAAAGVVSIVVHTPLNDRVAAAPVTLAVGVILLAYLTQLKRTRLCGSAPDHSALTVAESATVFVLVGLSLFWAANDYSAAVGRSRASEFVRELETSPETVVYSTENLHISAPGVNQTRCTATDAAYTYRYTGLTLMLQSGNQYVFVPRTWTTADGVALVVPRSDSIRLAFVPSSGLHGSGLDPTYACGPE
jgi:hypothetical protein